MALAAQPQIRSRINHSDHAVEETKTVQVIIDETGEGSLAFLGKLPSFGDCNRVGEGVYFVQTDTPKKLVDLAEKCEAVSRVEVI